MSAPLFWQCTAYIGVNRQAEAIRRTYCKQRRGPCERGHTHSGAHDQKLKQQLGQSQPGHRAQSTDLVVMLHPSALQLAVYSKASISHCTGSVSHLINTAIQCHLRISFGLKKMKLSAT